jgi:hypothetical protein
MLLVVVVMVPLLLLVVRKDTAGGVKSGQSKSAATPDASLRIARHFEVMWRTRSHWVCSVGISPQCGGCPVPTPTFAPNAASWAATGCCVVEGGELAYLLCGPHATEI